MVSLPVRSGSKPQMAHHLLTCLLPGPLGAAGGNRLCLSLPAPGGRPREVWPAGSGVPHGRFPCLVSSSPLWSQRAGQSPGAAARKAGGRGGRLASVGGGVGGAWAGSDAIFQVPPEAGASRCVHGDLPHCPFPRPLCCTAARGVVLTSRHSATPACPGRERGAHLGPTGSGKWLPAADGQMEPGSLPGRGAGTPQPPGPS